MRHRSCTYDLTNQLVLDRCDISRQIPPQKKKKVQQSVFAHQRRRVLVRPERLRYGPMPNWHPRFGVGAHIDEFVATVPQLWTEGRHRAAWLHWVVFKIKEAIVWSKYCMLISGYGCLTRNFPETRDLSMPLVLWKGKNNLTDSMCHSNYIFSCASHHYGRYCTRLMRCYG